MSFGHFTDVIAEAQRKSQTWNHTAFGMEPGSEVSSLQDQGPRGDLGGPPSYFDLWVLPSRQV